MPTYFPVEKQRPHLWRSTLLVSLSMILRVLLRLNIFMMDFHVLTYIEASYATLIIRQSMFLFTVSLCSLLFLSESMSLWLLWVQFWAFSSADIRNLTDSIHALPVRPAPIRHGNLRNSIQAADSCFQAQSPPHRTATSHRPPATADHRHLYTYHIQRRSDHVGLSQV